MLYSESDLVFPALWQLTLHPEGLTTSDFIHVLTVDLQPTGLDAEPLKHRTDTHFSQKVRNLTGSHKTIVSRGLARLDGGKYRITETGLAYLNKNEPIQTALLDQGFSERQIGQEAQNDYANLVIEEGTVTVRSRIQRQRSEQLRKAAIEAYTAPDGGITCIACGFDFFKVYGQHGKGYIVIHHTEPIHLMDEEGIRQRLPEALKKVAALCSNCHSMVHREKGHLLSMEDLKQLIRSQRSRVPAPQPTPAQKDDPAQLAQTPPDKRSQTDQNGEQKRLVQTQLTQL